MLFSRLSIELKVTLLAGLSLIVIVAILLLTSLSQSNNNARLVKERSAQMLQESAELRLQALGQAQAQRTRGYFRDTFQYARSLNNQLLFLRSQFQLRGTDAADLRRDLNEQLRRAAQDFPELLGLYVVFEPNALDGEDARFVDQGELASNEQGRFSLYWAHDEQGQLVPDIMKEEVLNDTSPGPSGAAYNLWYSCPKERLQLCVLDPYIDDVGGKKTLMTSIALPMLDNGKLVGVMGADISLSALQKLASTANSELYQGRGQISVISSGGFLAAHSQNAELLGQSLQKAFPTQAASLQNTLAQGKANHLIDGDQLQVSQPFTPTPQGKPWMVVLEVPRSVLQEPALELQKELDSAQTKGVSLTLLIGLIAVIAGLILMWLTARGVSRPILQVAAMLRNIASGEGDLTQRLTYAKRDELGELANWFNRFLDKLQPIIAEVKNSVQQARGTADQASGIAAQTHHGMQSQQQEIDQVATASNEMSATAHDVANNAAQAAEAARGANQASIEGGQVIERTTRNIAQLAEDMNQAMQQVAQLASNSEQIGSVLEVIRGIAEQTNLLALNAAIEAARAGEQGRGFAVVADEVRTLASRTQVSTGEIQKVLQELQSGSRNAVVSMDRATSLAQQAVAQSEKSGQSLQQITGSVSGITAVNNQIAAATEEQHATSQLIQGYVTEIQQMAQSAIKATGELGDVSAELRSVTERLQHVATQFKV